MNLRRNLWMRQIKKRRKNYLEEFDQIISTPIKFEEGLSNRERAYRMVGYLHDVEDRLMKKYCLRPK